MEKKEQFLKNLAIEYHKNGLNIKLAYKTLRPEVKDSTAEVEGSKALRNPKFQEFLQEIEEKAQEKYEYTIEKLVKELDEIEELAKKPIHGKNQNNYDLTNWLKIKSEKAKIFGLYAPTKTENTNYNKNEVDTSTLSNDDLKTLAKIQSKLN